MKYTEVLTTVIIPTLAYLPPNMDSFEARAFLLAIGMQESRFTSRRQLIKTKEGLKPIGPAAGFWQFEMNGGVRGVLAHEKSKGIARELCKKYKISPTPIAVWNALLVNDTLATSFARLLLWVSPRQLPKQNESEKAWEYYLDSWRPGKPHKKTWDVFFKESWEATNSLPW